MAAQDQGGDGRGAGLDPRTAALGAEAGSLPLPVGTLLERGFVIRSVLGRGGFGVTYMAEHTGLDRRVALKEHFPEQFAVRQGLSVRATSSGAAMFKWGLDRFLEEAKRLARFKHPSIVDVTDVFEANGTAYMALAFEEGETLGAWLDRLGRPPTQSELDRILTPILDALEHVHGHDILHRDIAPDNIMLRRDGTPVLIDFGAARQAMAEKSQTLTGIVKHGYSPPEQYARTSVRHGPWSDIYALGATLYRALLGKAPPEAPDRQIDDTVERLAEDGPQGYRPAFLAAIDRALALKPIDRPQSVAEWRSTLLPGGRTSPAPRPATAARPSNVFADPGASSRPCPAAPSQARVQQQPSSLLEPPPPSRTPWAMIACGLASAAVLGTALHVVEITILERVLNLRIAELANLSIVVFTMSFLALFSFFFAHARTSISHQWDIFRYIFLYWIGAIHFMMAILLLLLHIPLLGMSDSISWLLASVHDLLSFAPEGDLRLAATINLLTLPLVSLALCHYYFKGPRSVSGWRRGLLRAQQAAGSVGPSTAAEPLPVSSSPLRSVPQANQSLASPPTARVSHAPPQRSQAAPPSPSGLLDAPPPPTNAGRYLSIAALVAIVSVAAYYAGQRSSPPGLSRTDIAAPVSATKGDPALTVTPGSGRSFRDCPTCPEMVVVPAESFRMGSPASERERLDREGPQRTVTIARPFAVGKFEVTFAEWDACRAEGGCSHNPEDRGWGRGNRPVMNVSWDDITKEYLPWLSRKTGKTYRLLSEAEWEYVARAGTTTPFWWGSSITPRQANYDGSATPYKGGGAEGEDRRRTVPADSFAANAWGLYNVHGNVWEWVEDCWHDTYNGGPSDGSAWTTACAESRRVLRGGSWSSGPGSLRSAIRFGFSTDSRLDNYGFRVGRTF